MQKTYGEKALNVSGLPFRVHKRGVRFCGTEETVAVIRDAVISESSHKCRDHSARYID